MPFKMADTAGPKSSWQIDWIMPCDDPAVSTSRRASIWVMWFALAAVGGGAHADEVPKHNRADQKEVPPRPDASSAERRAKQLFDAIVRDDPALAQGVFFPRDAFLLVKDIRDPGRYFDQLHTRFVADIHALHKRLPGLANARFERFELARRGAFMKVGEEGNRLPYWASRHSLLHYVSDGQKQSFEVRVLITWDEQWYVIHLNEFH